MNSYSRFLVNRSPRIVPRIAPLIKIKIARHKITQILVDIQSHILKKQSKNKIMIFNEY